MISRSLPSNGPILSQGAVLSRGAVLGNGAVLSNGAVLGKGAILSLSKDRRPLPRRRAGGPWAALRQAHRVVRFDGLTVENYSTVTLLARFLG